MSRRPAEKAIKKSPPRDKCRNCRPIARRGEATHRSCTRVRGVWFKVLDVQKQF